LQSGGAGKVVGAIGIPHLSTVEFNPQQPLWFKLFSSQKFTNWIVTEFVMFGGVHMLNSQQAFSEKLWSREEGD